MHEPVSPGEALSGKLKSIFNLIVLHSITYRGPCNIRFANYRTGLVRAVHNNTSYGFL